MTAKFATFLIKRWVSKIRDKLFRTDTRTDRRLKEAVHIIQTSNVSTDKLKEALQMLEPEEPSDRLKEAFQILEAEGARVTITEIMKL